MEKLSNWHYKLSRRLSYILGSTTPWIFLLGILGVGLVTEGLSKLLDVWFGEATTSAAWPTLMVGLIIILIVIFGFDLPILRRGQSSISFETEVPRRNGLVVLVSPGAGRSAGPTMDFHFGAGNGEPGQKYCWLLSGPGTGPDSSRANAEALKDEFERKGITINIVDIIDHNNPKEVYEAVGLINRQAKTQYRLDSKDMIADFTGGTKNMSVGMVLACAAQDWDLQYMQPSKTTTGGHPASGAESIPMLINIDFFVSSEDEE